MTKSRPAWRAFALAGAVLLAVSGCGGSDDNGDNPPTQLTTGTVIGRVADANTGVAIAGVEVKIGALKATSDDNGRYSLSAVPLGIGLVAQFSKPTYAANYATVDVVGGKTSTADRRLAHVAVKDEISATAGGTVSLPGSAAQVQLPANGFVNAATGAAVSGAVTVEMTPIDPGKSPLNMPGNFRAQGEAVPIESFGALQVELRDAGGALLNLAPGKTATIRIPVPAGTASPPLSIPLYYFKESTGLWVREGTASLAGSPPQQYYEGTVSHFTVWNADRPTETMYINGCVVNGAGQPVSATVSSEGLDYYGSATVLAGADGKFKVPARRSSQVMVGASSDAGSDSVIVTTGETDMTLPECLVLAQKPPVIVSQPVNLTIAPGALNTLSVVANKATQYTWYRNGQPIDSGSRSLIIFGNAGAAAEYYVVVSNANGSVTSATVTVTVAVPQAAPVIVIPPQAASVLAGATPTFTVKALGDSLTYQWLRNGAEIASAQGPSLTLAPVAAADNGALYSVRVKNAAGTVVSATAALTVTAEAVAPGIAAQPENASVSVGQSATFVVLANGTAPFTYQWLRNGTAIAGATAASYQTPATTLADTGTKFSVRITNTKGEIVSSEATLTVSQGTSVAGLHLAFPVSINANGNIGYAAVPAAGGTAVPFWPVGAGEIAGYQIQGQFSNGVASNAHIRGMLFWKNQKLVRRDLIGTTGLPAEVQVSTLTSADLCQERSNEFASIGGDVTDMNRTWYVYQKKGADALCNTADDRFFAARADMGPAVAPLEVPRPLATVHSASGALTGWLIRNGQQMQRVGADFTGPVTLFTLPASDVQFEEGATLDNHWVFQSGNKIYAVNLGDAAPAALTTVATLATDESVSSYDYANGKDIVIAISGDAATRIVHYVTSTKAVNAVTSVAADTRIAAVTPTRVILGAAGGLQMQVLLTGGTAQAFYAPASPLTYVSQRGGERVWYQANGTVDTINSDGSGSKTIQNAKLISCISKAQDANDGACDAVIVLEGNVVRSYDAATGAVRVTYGTITIPNPPLTNMVFMGYLTWWGQSAVLSQYIFDVNNPASKSVVSYFLKTDQPGITPLAAP
jgi:hypothetical protein